MLPRGFTVALEHVPRFQASVEAEPTLGLLDRPCTQSACVAGSNALYPCLELLRISNAHHLSLAAVAPLPLHSVRPKLAVRCKDSLRATLGTEWILHVGAHHVPNINTFVSPKSRQCQPTTASSITDARRNVNVNGH